MQLKNIFNLHPDPNRPDNFLLHLLNIILYSNDFTFDFHTFLQTCGIPMGLGVASTLARKILIDFDNYAINGHKFSPKIFFRYLHDLFFIFDLYYI